MKILNIKIIASLFLLASLCLILWHCPTTITPTDQDPDMPDVPDVPDVPEPPDAPDLAVSLSKNKSAYLPTEAVTLMATVSNAGTTLSNATLFWYRSTDGSLDRENDTLLGSSIISNLAAGARVALTTNIAAANTASTNTYFAWADGGTNEVNPTNNSSATLVLAVPRTTYLPSLDFNTLHSAGNGTPVGIWSDGTNMWVTDAGDSKIYAYDLATKARNSSEDFDTLTNAGNDTPLGIWSDGITMWVGDNDDAKLYAYKLSDKTRDSAKDFDTLTNAGINLSYGHWSDGTTMWVADNTAKKIYAYSMATKARNTNEDFSTGDSSPQGIWSDGTTMWVANTSLLIPGGPKLLAYSLANKTRNSSLDFDVAANTDPATGNTHPFGLWSDGSTMWVVNVVQADNIQDKIFAFKK